MAAGYLSNVVYVVNPEPNSRMPQISKLGRDFVAYIAQNPVKPHELAIATRQRHVYLSSDNGKSWQQIAREGEGVYAASPNNTAAARKSAGR